MGGNVKIIPTRSLLAVLLFSFFTICYADEDIAYFKVIAGKFDLGQVETVVQDTNVFVNLYELLEVLDYPVVKSEKNNTLSTDCPNKANGFILHGDTLIRKDSKHNLGDSILLISENKFYIRNTYLNELCGIKATLAYGSLTLYLSSERVFPFEAKYEQNIRKEEFEKKKNNQVQPEQFIDTLSLRNLYLNTIGYSVGGSISDQGFDGHNVTLSGNAEFLKGIFTTNLSLTNYSTYKENQFTFKQQYEFNHKLLKQASLYRQSSTILMSGVRGYANGIYLSNDYTTFFNQQYYLFKTQSRPNANVEIYSNGQLVSFVTADSTGYIEALIPVSEGNNTISTVALNAFGESVSDNKSVYIAEGILAKKQFKYQFTLGASDESDYYTAFIAEYGLFKFMSLVTRIESVLRHNTLYFIGGGGLKLAPGKWLQMGVQIFPEYKFRSNLVGNAGAYLGYSLIYEKFNQNQKLVRNAPIDDISGSITTSLPVKRIPHSITFSLRNMRFVRQESFISTLRLNVFMHNLMITGYASMNSERSWGFDHLSYGGRVGYRINKSFYNETSFDGFLRTQEYIYTNRLQFNIANNLMGNLSATYYTRSKSTSLELGATYRIPALTFRANVRSTFKNYGISASAEGAMRIYPNRKVNFSNRNNSQSSLHVAAFVDKNANQKFDKGETILSDAKVLVKTGAEIIRKASGIYFNNIPPGHPFKVIVPRQILKDISWQITPYEKMIYMSEGQSSSIYIPVMVISEISGTVYDASGERKKPLINIPV
ncbi:MAG: hypothetical protein ACRCX5_03345, partial [Bacteroidales bacterium]